jgi:hypothetical protein
MKRIINFIRKAYTHTYRVTIFKNGRFCWVNHGWRPNKRYFVIRRRNTGAGQASDIIGITTNEDYAKSRQSVFCSYQEVKILP